MLEKPDIPDNSILTALQRHFGLADLQLAFLPLGADQNTAVYRATDSTAAYFVKLRRGRFDPAAVLLPTWFSDQGVAEIIPPLRARSGQLYGDLGEFKLILYPFVGGHDAYQAPLSPGQWQAFGRALSHIHQSPLPPALVQRIPRERYSSQWRQLVSSFLQQVQREQFDEPVAAQVTALLKEQRHQIEDLIGRASRLALQLQAGPYRLVLCHSDLHAGNLLIAADGRLFLVDWDEPILAPKERDLMYVGGGLLGRWCSPSQEERHFYPAYGDVAIDPAALAYYRYERIIQDIAAYCQELLLSEDGGADRLQSYHYLASNFLPGHTIEIAYQSDRTDQGSS